MRLIAFHYIKKSFFLDLIASIPIDNVQEILLRVGLIPKTEFWISLLGLLKMFRVLRLGKIIGFLNLNDDVKISLKLSKLVFLLTIYIHCVGCLWYYLVKDEEKWLPPLDYLWVQTDIYERSWTYQYWMAMYHSTLVMAGNDIGPRGTVQIAFCFLFILCGCIINANIFGEMVVLMAEMNKKIALFA